MLNHVVTATAPAVVLGLGMFVLDVLTSTTPFHNRKVSTMFALSVTTHGRTTVETAADETAAKAAALELSNRLNVSLMGLYGDDADYAGQVWDTKADAIGTWTIAAVDDAPVFLPMVDPQTSADWWDAYLVAFDADQVAQNINHPFVPSEDDEPSWWDLDEANERLTLTLTAADIDGWADEDADALGDYLESVYCDPFERDDEDEYRYALESGNGLYI
jgi:hypothetical protein